MGAEWRTVSHLRWWIGGLLFASTVINYIDRQTLSVLAPYLQAEHHWTNTDFASIVIAFRISYALVQFLGGRLIDLLGTRRGLTITVAWYSAMAMLTSLAGGLWSFRAFRFLLVLARQPTGRARPRPWASGFRRRSGESRWRCSTVARPWAARWRRLSWCGSITCSGRGGPRFCSPAPWGSCGCLSGLRFITSRRSIRESATRSAP